MSKEHRVSVDNGKYEFVWRDGFKFYILRHGEPIGAGAAEEAIHSMMQQLDAARVVVQAVRRACDVPAGIIRAIELHDRLTSDRTPPSEWCGAEPVPDTGPEKCPRCRFTPCRKMFQCREHWPDCAINHGGAECDMGSECGTGF